MEDKMNRRERAITEISNRIAAPAGRAFGRLLGRARYKGESHTWATPAACFVAAIDIGEGYEKSFGPKQ